MELEHISAGESKKFGRWHGMSYPDNAAADLRRWLVLSPAKDQVG